MAKDKNWIKLSRDLLEHPIWTGETFTTGQAWVDLLMLAAFEDIEHFYKGNFQVIHRGEIATSIRYLARRWHWNPSRVNRTLKSLEKAKMIRLSVTRSGTLISIENYDKFQSGRNTTGNATGNTTGNTSGNATGNDNKNIKEFKEKKNTGSASTSPDVPPAGYEVVDLPDGGTRYKPKGGKR